MEGEEEIMSHKSKEYKNAGIMFLVFGLFLGSYFLYFNRISKDLPKDAVNPLEEMRVLSYNQDEVKLVEIQDFTQRRTFETKEEGILLKEEPDLNWDSQKRDDFMANLLTIRATKNLGADIAKWEEFGLKDPLRWIRYDFKDGTQTILEVGNLAPANRGYYLKSSKDSTLYMVPVENVDMLFWDAEDLKMVELPEMDEEEFIIEE
jgi:hypothetical protein